MLDHSHVPVPEDTDSETEESRERLSTMHPDFACIRDNIFGLCRKFLEQQEIARVCVTSCTFARTDFIAFAARELLCYSVLCRNILVHRAIGGETVCTVDHFGFFCFSRRSIAGGAQVRTVRLATHPDFACIRDSVFFICRRFLGRASISRLCETSCSFAFTCHDEGSAPGFLFYSVNHRSILVHTGNAGDIGGTGGFA